VAFARALGVSDLVIGLTIIAAGTSMPEVATSIMAAVRASATSRSQRDRQHTFNILGCSASPAP